MKWRLLIMLVCGLHSAKGQDDEVLATCDSIFNYENFIVFKGDTLNRLNVEGKREGKWIEYDEWEVVTTTTLLDSNRTAVDTSLCGHILIREHYKDGILQGVWQNYYYGTETVHVQVTYVNGKVLGDIRSFYKSGSLRMHANAKPDEQNVTCTEYDEHGKLLRTYARSLAAVVKDLIQ